MAPAVELRKAGVRRGSDVPTSEYNELKAAMAHRDALREIAAAALADRMDDVIRKLVECEVLPPGTRPNKRSIVHGDD